MGRCQSRYWDHHRISAKCQEQLLHHRVGLSSQAPWGCLTGQMNSCQHGRSGYYDVPWRCWSSIGLTWFNHICPLIYLNLNLIYLSKISINLVSNGNPFQSSLMPVLRPRTPLRLQSLTFARATRSVLALERCQKMWYLPQTQTIIISL